MIVNYSGNSSLSIDSLTGLRFIAAMMVLISHFPIPGVSGFGLNIMRSGYAGVTVFFVLSGFIISLHYFDDFSRGAIFATWRSFFVARFARVYPVYILFNLYFLTGSSSGSDFLPYIFAVQTWSSDINIAYGQNPPSWSVGVEIFLYILFPFLAPVLDKLGLTSSKTTLVISLFVTFLVMFGAALFFSYSGRADLPYSDPNSAHRWLYRMPLARLGDFLIGIYAAIYYKIYFKQGISGERKWIFATYSSIFVIVVLMGSGSVLFSAFSWDIAYALPCFFLILGLSLGKGSRVAVFLGSPVLIILGEASYSLYLVHALMGAMLKGSAEYSLSGLIHYIMFVAFVVVVSIGVHKLIEVPSRSFLRRKLMAPV